MQRRLTILKTGGKTLKEINYKEWIEGIQQLNDNQPSLEDLIQDQINSYESNKDNNKN